MRIFVILALVLGLGFNGNAKSLQEGLKFLEVSAQKKEILTEATRKFYQHRKNYLKNSDFLESQMLNNLAKQGYENVDFLAYEAQLEKISKEYNRAKIAFYRTIGQVLSQKELAELREFMEE